VKIRRKWRVGKKLENLIQEEEIINLLKCPQTSSSGPVGVAWKWNCRWENQHCYNSSRGILISRYR